MKNSVDLDDLVKGPLGPISGSALILFPIIQACQNSADPRNSAVFDFPGVVFVIRPDPMRKYFVLWGVGGGGLDFLRYF